jgi:hypothetical protein
MRWLLIVLLIFLGICSGAYLKLKSYPFEKYSAWITGKGFDKFYEISNYQLLFLAPTGLEDIPPYQEDYVQLWKEFPIRNTLIPLPTRHPLFQTVPIIEMTSKTSVPHVGISFLNPKGREISHVFQLPTKIYNDHSQGQDLFKLPYFRNRIRKKNLDDIWKDVFSYKIEAKRKSIEEMIYDLYILHLRSKLLPPQTTRYGLIQNGKQAMVELVSTDKDYIVELVMTFEAGSIFSYVLKTERNEPESLKLRAKFLNSISFTQQDESIGRILYTEFKQLNFARQVDQEGLLYLFAAWSQDTDNIDWLKEMIYYLERGKDTKKQLKSIYKYSYKRYRKTFSSRKDVEETDDPEIALQRNIELAEKEATRKAESSKVVVPITPELGPDEKINEFLKKAKENKIKENEEMIVH